MIVSYINDSLDLSISYSIRSFSEEKLIKKRTVPQEMFKQFY